ncbi:MAG: ABC transporter ATP-binding protein [Ruminococcaceae bacterium]|nr:ABC transporter ATP-binding protein [Oscillospiraceae bacterium]
MAKNTYNVDERLETPFNFDHLKRSFAYVKTQSKLLLTALIVNIIIIVLNLSIPYFTQVVLDKCIPNGDVPLLIKIGILYIVVLIVTHLLSYIQSRCLAIGGQRIVHKMREDLFNHLQKLPFSYFDSRPHGKILVRVVNYVNNVANFLSNGLVNFLLQIITLVFITIFMFFTSVPLALVTISGVPFLVLFLCLIKNKQRRSWLTVNNKNSNVNAYLGENINGIKVSQTFSRQKINESIFRKLILEAKKAWMYACKISFKLGPVIEVITFSVTCLIYLSFSFVFEGITIGVLFAMTAYASRFWQPIQAIGSIYNELINTGSYLERIFETLDEPISIDDKEDAYDIGEIEGNVEFKDVTFSYEEGFTIFEHLNFSVKAGQSIALVGPTGAGKTTIVNLISRFYDIDSGALTIDGHNIGDVTIKSLRKNMGIMLQDPFIFKGTIADNIRYGKLDATIEEIIDAAKTVHAHDFIEKLPLGYDTPLSENGSSISAGQRQLISFARTLLSNPRILILDEATSAIDTKTELLLQEGIKSLLKNRTSFIIAHRLSTIQNCDKICYICDKGIKESGTHEELLKAKGFYYNLHSAQIREIS